MMTGDELFAERVAWAANYFLLIFLVLAIAAYYVSLGGSGPTHTSRQHVPSPQLATLLSSFPSFPLYDRQRSISAASS
jgi:hypothetical protein